MLPATAGDPISGLKWTRKTTLKVAEELGKLAITVSARTVARLLEGLKFRLRVNHKKLSHGTAATRSQRNRQFQYIEAMRQSFAKRRLPVISVDTKKKELVGCFRNAGAVWVKSATPTNDHDFRSQASHIASPYGVFDPLANRGHLFVGTSYDTPAFATDCISRWWNTNGYAHYPKANKLLILADSGGSNGSRCRAWKHGLMTKLCIPHGLQVTVCHYPPGASKWNPIEHRLFSQISNNWAGEPLLTLEKMLNFIRTTKTTTGLRVRATLMKGHYPKGLKPTDDDMAKLAIQSHEILPDWNYTIKAPTKM
jgi:Rhodopirellula transposase DDE domain